MSDMNSGKPCRKDLLEQINRASFAVDDSAALEYFHEYNKIRNQAMREYAKYYGPLTIDTTVASCTDRWNWINEPWPWQEGWC